MGRSKKTGLSGLVLTFGLLAALVPPAAADTVGPITFEPPTYALGSVNGQNGWVVTNPAFDQAVVANTAVPALQNGGFLFDDVTVATDTPVAPPPPVQRCGGMLATVDLAQGQRPTAGADRIAGTAGNDVVNGLGGDDIICGQGGHDRLNGASGNDRVFGGGGNDTMFGGTGSDVLRGRSGNDVCDGGPGRDIGQCERIIAVP